MKSENAQVVIGNEIYASEIGRGSPTRTMTLRCSNRR
jgi:hypothetical protein